MRAVASNQSTIIIKQGLHKSLSNSNLLIIKHNEPDIFYWDGPHCFGPDMFCIFGHLRIGESDDQLCVFQRQIGRIAETKRAFNHNNSPYLLIFTHINYLPNMIYTDFEDFINK